jgi:HEAT repeat protein
VRATSILTLLLHDDASALEAVRRLRDDHSKVVRAAVILFQLHAGEKVQTAPLLDLLYAPGQLPADPLLQELITEAGQYLTEAQLRDRLQAHSGLQPQWDTAAGIALLNKNDPQQLRAVLAQASNAAGSRQLEAIRALAHARDPQVVYVLEEQVKDCPSLEGRLAAAYALSRFGSTKGVSPALDYLSDEARHAEESTAGTRLTQLAYATCAAAGDKQVLRQLGEWFDLESPGLARIACAGAVLELCARLGP